MSIKIITDTTSDIDEKIAKELGVYLASLSITVDGKEYTEGVDITHDNFYEISKDKKVLTSQPSPERFLEIYQEAKEKGEKIIGLFVSIHLSGTFQSACIAREMIDYEDIYLIDTSSISVGVHLMVKTALRLIQEGVGYKELCEKMEEYKSRLDAYAIIDDLDHLKRSGRLSAGKTFIGSLLQLKPITTLSGKVDVLATVRGSKAAIEKTMQFIDETSGRIDTDELCLVGYTGKKNEWYKDFKQAIVAEYNNENKVMITPIGASVSNHVGAGTFAVGFFKKEV